MTQEAAVYRRQRLERREVIAVLSDRNRGACTTTYVAGRLGWDNRKARRVLHSAARLGLVKTEGNGSTRWWWV